MSRKSARLVISSQKLDFNNEIIKKTEINVPSTATVVPPIQSPNTIHNNAVISRAETAKRKLEKQIYEKRLKQFEREIQGRKVTELDQFGPMAYKKQSQWNSWCQQDFKVTMKLFQDFVGFAKEVESDYVFDATTNYWDISIYRCYHLDKCIPNGINEKLTDAMKLRLNNTQRQIQLSVHPRYKFMFEDELNIEILKKQGGMWLDANEEERKQLSFYDFNRL